MSAILRSNKTQLRTLISVTRTYTHRNSSQAFHRTHCVHTQPVTISPQPHDDPIDFHHLRSKCNEKDQKGTLRLVKLVEKAKGFTSKMQTAEFVSNYRDRVNANHAYHAIWALRDDWELALLAFELNVERGSVNEAILSLIVWVLGTHKQFDVASSLISDFSGKVNTRRAMLALIERYAAADCHEKAIKAFKSMEDPLKAGDQNALYYLLRALCKYGSVEEAEEFMLKNKKLYSLETEGFNIILHGWCTISMDIFEAKRVWRAMSAYCITPDAVSYTHLISCVSRAGNLIDALRFYDQMKKRGWVPGLEVYNSLMYAMAREKCVNEALKLLEKIKELGFQPDCSSYNCLIVPLCEAGMSEEASALLVTMSQDGFAPTLETYKALLTVGDLDSTFDILQKMKNDKMGLDSSTFLLIFDRFFKVRQPENVLKVWVEMEDFGVNPEPAHYYSLIFGLANCGCLSKAKEMRTEMLSNGIVDDPKLKKLFQRLEGPETGSQQGRMR